MTVFLAQQQFAGSSGDRIVLIAGTYELRLITANPRFTSNMSIYAGASITGGSAMTVVPYRQGAPAASATARWGSVNVSGGTRTDFGLVGPYSPTYDFTILPGSALVCTLTTGDTSSIMFNFAFEEMLLDWHY